MTVNVDPAPREGLLRRIVRCEHARAAAVLTALLLLFFGTPLAKYDSVYFSTADMLQDFALLNVGAAEQPGNRILSDPAIEMQPWLFFNRDELFHGRLPVWNPYNSSGVPHLGNMQSAVFSPFSLPFYVLGFKAALLVSAFLKLFSLGFFTWLFLRALRISQLPALIGATAFMFCGHNVLLLAYPHSGAAVALPAGLFFAERAFQSFEASRRLTRNALAWLLGLSAAFAAGLFAGQPEPFFFCVLAVALYVAFRLAGFCFERSRGEPLRARLAGALRLGGAFALAGLFALCLGALQMLPFLEYLQNSSTLGTRMSGSEHLRHFLWPLFFFPDLLGNPTLRYNLSARLPPPNYEQANTMYLGAVALLLALLSLPYAPRDRRLAFFAALGLVWLLAIYDLFGANSWIGWLPGARFAPITRSQPLVIFSFCVCAAFGADKLLLAARSASAIRISGAAAVLGFAVVVLAIALLGADWQITEIFRTKTPEPRNFATAVPEHLAYVGSSSLAAMVALAGIFLVKREGVRTALLAAVLAAVFAQGGWLHRDYNTTTSNELFFPRTPEIAELQRAVGERTLLIANEDTLPPDANLVYRVHLLSGYDFLWIARYDALFQSLFKGLGNWRNTLGGTELALKLFGVEQVLTLGPWIPIGNGRPLTAEGLIQVPTPIELVPEHELAQTFVCEGEGLQGIALHLSAHSTPTPSWLRIRVEEVQTGEVLFEELLQSHTFLGAIQEEPRTLFGSQVRLSVPGAQHVIRFAPRRDSRNASYRIRLTATEGDPLAGWVAWMDPRFPVASGELLLDGVPLAGGLQFDWSTCLDSFEPVATIGPFHLWNYARSPGRYWLVDGVRSAGEDELGAVLAPDWDPAGAVVLEGGAERTGSPEGSMPLARPEILARSATEVRLRVDAARDCHLVLASPWYPGWRARIDGRNAPLLRANYAFNALAIAAGRHEVVFAYEPDSVRWGLWISGTSALAASVLLLRFAWRRRSRRGGPAGA
jgi:membrane protein YfhO